MRSLLVWLVTICWLSTPLVAQSTSDPECIRAVTTSVTIQNGGNAVSDVSLSASAALITGDERQSATAQLKGTVIGQGRVDLLQSSVTSSEIRLNTGAPAGQWTQGDGVYHDIPSHNLLSDPSWFFPLFLGTRAVTASYICHYIGVGSLGGKEVTHVQLSEVQPSAVDPKLFPIQSLSRADLYLDTETSLPVALFYNQHPDNDSSTNVPLQILFSDYRKVDGVTVPFTVQKFVNNSLVFDIRLQAVAANTGLSSADFNLH